MKQRWRWRWRREKRNDVAAETHQRATRDRAHLPRAVVAATLIVVSFSTSALDTVHMSPLRIAVAGGPPCNTSFDPYNFSAAPLHACGIQTFPFSSVQPLPDGGTEVDYNVDGVKMGYLSAPADFNPRTASSAQLREYGLTPRPSDPIQARAWDTQMNRLVFVRAPAFVAVLPPTGILPIREPADPKTPVSASTNWSGYEATSSANTINYVKGQWTEPQTYATSCPTDSVATWAGLGGDAGVNSGNNNLAQAGTGVNWPGLGSHQGWTEDFPIQQGVVAQPIYGHTGYTFYASVRFTAPYFELDLYDSQSGRYLAVRVYATNTSGYTADFIVERAGANYLRNFGTLQFTSTSIGDSYGHNGVLGSSNWGLLVDAMVPNSNTSQAMAAPGSVSNGAFSDYWSYCG